MGTLLRIRNLYYKLVGDRAVTFEKPDLLKGKKWKVGLLAGRSYWKGYYEPPVTQLILDNLRSDSVFFDIGANVGYFSLLAATKVTEGYIHSFEPDKPTFAYSDSIRTINQLTNWTTNNVGVGERTETLYYQLGYSSTTGFISDTGGEATHIVSLDEYVTQHKITKLDLIKIDVEGYGGHVLRGATKVIHELKPAILMEFHAGTEEYAVFNELVRPHYTVQTIEGRPVTDTVGEPPYHVLALPK